MPKSKSFETLIAALAPHVDVYKPAGAGPFPVVVQFHGCGGKKVFQQGWANAAQRAGIAAIVVDSFAHRAISRVQAYCTVCVGARLSGRQRAGDLYAILEWARRQPWADKHRLAVAGWSHGGWTILDALALDAGSEMSRATGLDDLPAAPFEGVRGAFLVYPYVGFGCLARRKALRHDLRPLALVGSDDVIVGARSAKRQLERIRTPGAPIRVEWLEGCTHAFDEPDARDLRVRYNAAQTASAHAIYASYLRENLVASS